MSPEFAGCVPPADRRQRRARRRYLSRTNPQRPNLIFAVAFFEKDGTISDWEYCTPNSNRRRVL